MVRSLSFAGVALIAVLAWGNLASGQEPRPGAGRVLNPRLAAPGTTLGVAAISLPGYPLLQTESVQKELGLTPEQTKKLKEIAKKNTDAMKEDPRLDLSKLRDMTPEERGKAQKEMVDRVAKRTAETKKQIEEVLTAKQIEQLKEVAIRQRAGSMLFMPHVLQQIELTDEQKQQMQQIREETQAKINELQQESQKKVMGLLTPDQTKKLKELSGKGWGWGQPAPQSPPKERPKGKRRPKPVDPEEDS